MKKNINVEEIEINRGQIYGLPKNPRLIRDERFEALKKSIQDAPEMLDLRELIVYPHEGKYVIIGGNMRFRACQDLGYTEIPCKVLPEETPVAKLREYVIKDNEPLVRTTGGCFRRTGIKRNWLTGVWRHRKIGEEKARKKMKQKKGMMMQKRNTKEIQIPK